MARAIAIFGVFVLESRRGECCDASASRKADKVHAAEKIRDGKKGILTDAFVLTK